MLKIRRLSAVVGKRVYTSEGDFFGEIQEVNLSDNKVDSWKIKVGNTLMSLLGGARGVIIPHQFVKAVGDIFIVNKSSLPIQEEPEELEVEGAVGEGEEILM